jgi:hypothetical protein
MRERNCYSDLQIRRWGRLLAKLLVIAMEDALGNIINQNPALRKVFAAAAVQGLRHLADVADMPEGAIVESRPQVRLVKLVGMSEDDGRRFREKHPEVQLLTDADHYAIVAAGMLRGSALPLV